MSLGRQREYETETVCDCVMLLKYLVELHPENIQLQNVARKAYLIAVMLLAREKRDLADPNANICIDRCSECRICDQTPPCRPCKYATTTARREVIRRSIGQEALDLIDRYGQEACDKLRI